MTRWENSHERYFSYLGTLSFDRAKELLEKDGNKIHPDFFPYFQQIFQCERSYHNFGFVHSSKGNLSSARKEKTLFECYSDLHMSLIHRQSTGKTTNSNRSTIDESSEIDAIEKLLEGLISFLHVRNRLIKLYDQISNAVKQNERNVRLEVFLPEIIVISQIDTSSLNISVLNSIHRLLKHETDCLLLLIQSYVAICDYQYMDGISTLHQMQFVLKEWNENIESQQTTNHRFTLSGSSALNFFKTPAKPALYSFYSKFHEFLVAKFTLYFSEILLEYGGIEAKSNMSKATPDFAARIAHFHRRSNVELIALILHTKKDSSKSNNNQNDQKPFEIIFSHPTKFDSMDEITQQLINKTEINHANLCNEDKLIYIGSLNQSKTCFLQNVDPRFTLALIFASQRQERDTTVSNFIGELIDLLRGSRLLLIFKNPPK